MTNRLNRLTTIASTFRKDDRGGAAIEYVLIAGLIIVGCISLIAVFGNKVLARWNSVNVTNL